MYVDQNMYCFSTFCFICLDAEDNLQHLTCVDTDGVQLLEKFNYCDFKNEIAEDATVSICHDCIGYMNMAYKFKAMCLSSNDVFMKYLELNDEEKASGSVRNVSLKTIQTFQQQLNIDVTIKTEPEDYSSEEATAAENASSMLQTWNELLASTKTNADLGLKREESSVTELSIDNKIKVEEETYVVELATKDVSSILQTFRNELSSVKTVDINLKQDESSVTSFPKISIENETSASESKSSIFSNKNVSLEVGILEKCPCLIKSLRNSISSEESPLPEMSITKNDCPSRVIRSDSPDWIDVNFEDPSLKTIASDCSKRVYDKLDFESIYLKEEPNDSDCYEDDTILDNHMCKLCSRTFKRKSCLQRHMYTHSGEKLHQCSICSKSFSLKSNLLTHMLIHTGAQPHKCDQCDKSFSHKSNLYTHRTLHSGEKKHQCLICEKYFRKISNYKSHMMIHTEERPHTCQECSRPFRLKSHLKRHMLTHAKSWSSQELVYTGDIKHQCSICHKCFPKKSNYDSHMLIHREERPHTCVQCNKSFRLKGHLKRHMQTQSH